MIALLAYLCLREVHYVLFIRMQTMSCTSIVSSIVLLSICA